VQLEDGRANYICFENILLASHPCSSNPLFEWPKMHKGPHMSNYVILKLFFPI
jgi:hypothetical protein